MIVLNKVKPYVKYAMLLFVGVFGFVFIPKTFIFAKTGIYDYDAVRDRQAVIDMFHHDWELMMTVGNNDRSGINFMLDNASSSKYFAKHDMVQKVLLVDNKTAGYIAYYPHSFYNWQFLFLIIAESYRGQGWSKQMVRYVLEDMFARGCIKVTMTTRTKNKRARSLYAKMGFKEISDDGTYIELVYYKDWYNAQS